MSDAADGLFPTDPAGLDGAPEAPTEAPPPPASGASTTG